MTAAHPEKVLAAPVRPRRARPGANAHRPTAPVAAGPRAGAWVHVPRSSSSVEAATALTLQALAPVVRLREDTIPVRRVPSAPRVAAESGAEPRYEWTPRGLAVLLTIVAAVVGAMAVTLVAAFLAVSAEPLPAGAAAPQVAARVAVAPAQP